MLVYIILLIIIFPEWVAEWWVRAEAHLPKARAEYKAILRKKEAKRRMKNIRRIRNNKFKNIEG